jgi:hypothetical protein
MASGVGSSSVPGVTGRWVAFMAMEGKRREDGLGSQLEALRWQVIVEKF